MNAKCESPIPAPPKGGTLSGDEDAGEFMLETPPIQIACEQLFLPVL
jgi:hypothetical protein